MRGILRAILVALVVVLFSPAALAEEGKKSEATAGLAGVLDPCKLLTLAEVQTVLGVSVGAPESSGALCVYSPASGSAPTLSIIAARASTKASVEAAFEKARTATQEANHDVVEVPGLGDAAYTAGHGHLVVFIKGSATVSVMVMAPGSTKDYRDRLIRAAKIVAGRL